MFSRATRSKSTALVTVAAAVLALSAAAGCGGEPPEPTAAAPTGAGATAGRASGSSLGNDMLAASPPSGAIPETPIALSSGTAGKTPAPKVFYLDYSDGTESQNAAYNACPGVAPKFTCAFASTLTDCQRQIQAYLDAWYADFNVIFTLTRPTSGAYYTEVVSSGGGAWCKTDSGVAGVAPFLCTNLNGGVAYTLDGGDTAYDTAVIIAHEQGHLVGLEHTSDPADMMYPYTSTTTNGFVNGDDPVTGDRCSRTTQSSYQMMMTALGPWPGGSKPSAFGCMDDTQPPSLTVNDPAEGAQMGHDFAVKVNARDDCGVANVAVQVMPQGLSASVTTPPYEWDLTGISGAQTITVTATDANGRASTATVHVTAPAADDPGGATTGAAGCAVASGAIGAAGLLPAAVMLLLFGGRGRRSARRARRAVPGALLEAPRP